MPQPHHDLPGVQACEPRACGFGFGACGADFTGRERRESELRPVRRGVARAPLAEVGKRRSQERHGGPGTAPACGSRKLSLQLVGAEEPRPTGRQGRIRGTVVVCHHLRQGASAARRIPGAGAGAGLVDGEHRPHGRVGPAARRSRSLQPRNNASQSRPCSGGMSERSARERVSSCWSPVMRATCIASRQCRSSQVPGLDTRSLVCNRRRCARRDGLDEGGRATAIAPASPRNRRRSTTGVRRRDSSRQGVGGLGSGDRQAGLPGVPWPSRPVAVAGRLGCRGNGADAKGSARVEPEAVGARAVARHARWWRRGDAADSQGQEGIGPHGGGGGGLSYMHPVLGRYSLATSETPSGWSVVDFT